MQLILESTHYYLKLELFLLFESILYTGQSIGRRLLKYIFTIIKSFNAKRFYHYEYEHND